MFREKSWLLVLLKTGAKAAFIAVVFGLSPNILQCCKYNDREQAKLKKPKFPIRSATALFLTPLGKVRAEEAEHAPVERATMVNEAGSTGA